MNREACFRIALKDSPRMLSASEGVEALLGFSVNEFISGRVALKQQIHSEDAEIADILFFRDGKDTSGTVNLRIRGADGKIRCVKAHYAKTSDSIGEHPILALVLRDARDIQEPGDQSLVESYKTLLAQPTDYIYIKNRNHVLLGANRPVAELTGRYDAPAELAGKTDYDLFPEQEADLYYRLEKQVFVEGQCVSEVQQVVARDGTKHWIDNRKYPVKGPTGETVGLFGIAPDITFHLEARQRLRESEESLREAQKIGGLGSFVLDFSSKKWKFSEEFEKLLGLGPECDRCFEGGCAFLQAAR
jgi:PAS domain S-box-containing protein